MNIHEYIKAKGSPDWTSLYHHICHEIIAIVKFAEHAGLNPETARLGAILHDIGKVHPIFQQFFEGIWPSQTFRHELASLFFLPLVPKDQWEAVIQMIVAHHKSICNDVNSKGILDIQEYEDDPLTYHLGDWENWNPIALDIMQACGIQVRPINRKEALESWKKAVSYCQRVFKSKRGYSEWKGLLMGADYFASSQKENTAISILKAFEKPVLNFFNRPNKLYPLSEEPVSDERPHTIAITPTGSGKTDYLLRRCLGRIFYILPFQASCNALFFNLKRDLRELNPDLDIRLLHGASSIIDRTDKSIDPGLQGLVGASVKILTPYQLASIVFGSKGYESIILDLKGCDIILDEIHTYSTISQAIVLKLVAILKSLGCRIHIGTATMPSALFDKIIKALGIQNVLVIRLPQNELQSFNRHIIYKLDDWESSFAIIKKAIDEKEKILIIFNQVKKARRFFEEIETKFPGLPKLLLHRKFKLGDRIRKELQLIGLDEKGAPTREFNNSTNACIVISTQVIEVSLDISFDIMITESAPIDALLQRFGRINRKRNESKTGQLKPIFVVAPTEDLTEVRPYSLNILLKSFSVLPDHQVLQETALQGMIDQVFPDIDFMQIENLAIYKQSGRWSIPFLTHRSTSLLDILDIDEEICITESDVKNYKKATPENKALLEIPVRFHQIKSFSRLEKDKKRPFVIPDSFYCPEKGLLLDFFIQ